jgi:hypothetical protein
MVDQIRTLLRRRTRGLFVSSQRRLRSIPPSARWRSLLQAASALAVGATAPAANAAPRTASLGWVRLQGAESCTGTRALAEQVEARLGRPVFASAARADVAIEGRIERDPDGGWRATIAITAGDETTPRTRELRSYAPSCRDFDGELALVISVMLDPEAPLPSSPEGPRGPEAPGWFPPPPVPAPLPPSAPPAPLKVAVSPEGWRAASQAGAVIGLGLLPGLGTGVTLREQLAPPVRWAMFELGGTLWFPARTSGSTTGATFWLAEGHASLCPLSTVSGRFWLAACAGARAGAMRATGFGFSGMDEQQTRATFAASLEAWARVRLIGPLAAGVGVGSLVPVIRTTFCFDCGSAPVAAGQTVFQMSPLAGTGYLTLGVVTE